MSKGLKAFDAVSIRDTDTYNSTVIEMGSFFIKTIIIESSLNQTVSLQCQASANDDFSKSFDVGSSFDVSATTNIFQTCDSFFPYFRIEATCDVAPTTGDLTIWVIGARGEA